MEKVDCVVVGAGVIGLAVARLLAQNGNEVIVLEAEPDIGTHTSSRNSEVIHAGIYYPPGSLKARCCLQGKAMLYQYCREKEIRHRRVGKLIVANSTEDIEILQRYRERAEQNGLHDLDWLQAEDVAALEPSLQCLTALLSPSTGIIDSHELMLSLQGDIEAGGGAVVCRSRVEEIIFARDGFRVGVAGHNESTLTAAWLVNAAGLWSQSLGSAMQGIDLPAIPERHLAKGHYYTLRGTAPFSHLIYPAANGGGLGIHLTLDLAGQGRFGPDVQWIDHLDYEFDGSRKSMFVDAIRKYYPDLEADQLVEGYTGIRPKLSGPGEPPADFVIQGASQHGVPGLVNLFGIESPGLTAALAIADRVVAELRAR
jgi:L-2-hydroxyglutarate oxidase LhgO